jgi:hypothetical protein
VLLSCELEWKTHEELQSYLAVFFESDYELYGVVRFRLDTPIWDEPYLPHPDYGIIFASMRADVGEVGTMLGIEDGHIAFIDHVCIGPPAYFLDGGPPYNGQLELILLGPAFH